MPKQSARPCAHAGCGKLVQGARYCEAHAEDAVRYARERRAYADTKRPSSGERGYSTSRWRKYRAWFLSQPEHVLCACGCGKLSQEVDHIIPVAGPDDPLFWDGSNHQGLTKTCHSAKTQRDRAKGLTRDKSI